MDISRRLRIWWRVVVVCYAALAAVALAVIAFGYDGVWVAVAAIVFGGIACLATVRMLTHQSRVAAGAAPTPPPATGARVPTPLG
jgi:hypothetical protein